MTGSATRHFFVGMALASMLSFAIGVACTLWLLLPLPSADRAVDADLAVDSAAGDSAILGPFAAGEAPGMPPDVVELPGKSVADRGPADAAAPATLQTALAPASAPGEAAGPAAAATVTGGRAAASATIAPAAATPATSLRTSFDLQFGLFFDDKTASGLQDGLARYGFDTTILEKPTGDGKIWYLVRYGPFSNLQHAVLEATYARRVVGLDPRIVRIVEEVNVDPG